MFKKSSGEDKATIDVDLGFFEYHAGYDDEDNYTVKWNIDWFWILVIAFWSWVLFVA